MRTIQAWFKFGRFLVTGGHFPPQAGTSVHSAIISYIQLSSDDSQKYVICILLRYSEDRQKHASCMPSFCVSRFPETKLTTNRHELHYQKVKSEKWPRIRHGERRRRFTAKARITLLGKTLIQFLKSLRARHAVPLPEGQ